MKLLFLIVSITYLIINWDILIVAQEHTIEHTLPDPLKKSFTPDAKSIVCYYASWKVYCAPQKDFVRRYVPPNLCSHLIHAFANVLPDGIVKEGDDYADADDELGQ